MPSKNTKFYSLILIMADFFVLLLAFAAAYVLRVQFDNRPLLNDIYASEYFVSFLFIIPFWIMIFATLGLYQASTYNRRLVEWGKIAVGAFIGILLVIGWEYVSETSLFPARLVAAYALIASFLLIVFEREILRLTRSILFRSGRGTSRVLIIGDSAATRDIADNLSETHRSGYNIVAIAGPKRILPPGLDVVHFTSVESALKEIEHLNITTIIQTDLYDSSERNQQILGAAQVHHISYSFIPGEAEFYAGKNTVDIFLGYPMISVSQTPLIGWGAIVKRILDLIIVIVSSPVWLVILGVLAILQKIFDNGPIFFTNIRLGQYGKKINVYKLRSMKQEYSGQDAIKIFKAMGRNDLAEEYAKTRKIVSDPRITRFGRFLRATSLDELPQIINVLRGEMSLVGPRPILPDEKSFYKKRGSLLFSVKPGITGLWQVSGRSSLSFEGRVELELFYAQNWSFWLDIKILFKTISVVLRKKGAE